MVPFFFWCSCWPVADGHVTIDLFSSCLVVTSLIGCGFGWFSGGWSRICGDGRDAS